VSLGRPCTFLRLAVCNQHCSWCDTPFTWKWTEYDTVAEVHAMSYLDVATELQRHGALRTKLVVISGGEPMMQQRQLWEMMADLYHEFWHATDVEIETAGTIAPHVEDGWNEWHPARWVQYNVSPKLENSGNPV